MQILHSLIPFVRNEEKKFYIILGLKGSVDLKNSASFFLVDGYFFGSFFSG